MNYLKGLKTDVGIIFWFYIKYGFTQPGIGRQIDSMCSKSQILKKKFIIAFAFPCCDCHIVVLC